MSQESGAQVRFFQVDAERQGQRLDNFLLLHLKGVPKSLLYRLLRKGQIRVNGKRAKPDQRVLAGDKVRVAPLVTKESQQVPPVASDLSRLLHSSLLFEDDCLRIINKPAGLAVHGGSGVQLGLIEAARQVWQADRFLELVHRIDRDTSGVIVMARKRSALRAMHEQLRLHQMRKQYWCLVVGAWSTKVKQVDVPLLRQQRASGERVVRVNQQGQQAKTMFKLLAANNAVSWLQASPVSGRTHQIRVHCQHAGHAILGDDKYACAPDLLWAKDQGVKRLCLHAASLQFRHPKTEQLVRVEATMPTDMGNLVSKWGLR